MARWKAGIASVASGLSALLVPATPVTAEPDKPAPEPAVAQECGADLKHHAAELAADICGGNPTLTRTAACVIEDGILLIFAAVRSPRC
ncbi:hypothetical protein [Nonomuraea guangzhouensis]|uniref:Uncharacterized protein n=1 Tax=Nonomuraea guangzhouensis TaxID=1291555 RepID=A0ABW4GKJ7_9ACTN|nr:hypothetical protein [Nonomuraea guangzhouensis]